MTAARAWSMIRSRSEITGPAYRMTRETGTLASFATCSGCLAGPQPGLDLLRRQLALAAPGVIELAADGGMQPAVDAHRVGRAGGVFGARQQHITAVVADRNDFQPAHARTSRIGTRMSHLWMKFARSATPPQARGVRPAPIGGRLRAG